MLVRLIWALAAIGLLFAGSAQAVAAPTAEQRAEIQAIGTLLTKAGNLYKESKFKEAGEVVKEVQSRLDKLASNGDQQAITQLGPLHKRLLNAHALLELEGIALPALKPLEVKAAPANAPPGKVAGKAGSASVSFVKDVAPILNARCGTCHIRNPQNPFPMTTYEALMKGPPKAGKVITPGDAAGSVLITKVE